MKTQITSALLAAPTGRQGALVPAIASVQRELKELGLVGPDGGLTRAGTIARQRAMSAAEDAAFGA